MRKKKRPKWERRQRPVDDVCASAQRKIEAGMTSPADLAAAADKILRAAERVGIVKRREVRKGDG